MTNNLLSRGIILVAALALTACPTGKKCSTNADCSSGQICSVMSGTCTTGTGGGIGGGTGGGVTGGGTGGASGGGTGGSTGGGTGDGGTNSGGETCELAALITPGTLMGDTTGKMMNYDVTCTGGPTPGPDVVYQISVPAGQRLTATATPAAAVMADQYDVALYLIASPPSNCNAVETDGGSAVTCLSASDNSQFTDAPETVSYLNSGTTAADVFIVVDSYLAMSMAGPDGGVGAASQGKFTLVTTIAQPAMGDTCATAIPLPTTGTAVMGDLANYGPDYTGAASSCRGSVESNDMAYQVKVQAGQLLTVVVTPGPTFDPTISVSESAADCDVTCIGGVDIGSDGDPEVYTYKNTSAVEKTLFVVVDGYDLGGSVPVGTFSITASVVMPPADDVCAQPITLVAGAAPLTAQTITNYANDYGTATSTGCGFSSGSDRVYAVASVPDGQRLTVTATPTAMANPSLSLVDGAANCGTACVASASSAGLGAVETLVYTNRTGGPKDYLIIVDFTSSSTGTFDISAVLSTPPGDDACQGPTLTTLALNATLAGQTTVGYANDYQNDAAMVGCATTGALGPDRVYLVSVPPGERGTVTVTPTADAGFNPSVNFVEGAAAVCAAIPRVCVAGSNAAGANLPESARVYNTTGSAKTYFAIVDSTSPPGAFDIGFTAASPPVDDTCTRNTTTLTAGTRNDNLTGFSGDYLEGLNCQTATGPDRVYRVQLAPNEKYTGTVTPTGVDGGYDPVLNFVPGPAANCDAAPLACRGGADSTARNQPETAIFTNNTGASLSLYLVVGDYFTNASNRDFSLVSTITTAAAGESCQLPQTVGAGMLTGQTLVGLSADVVFNAASAATCIDTGSLGDRVYAISVAAGKVLTVVATPAGNENLAVNVIDGTAASCNDVMDCATSANDGVAGEPETVTFTNSTGATKIVFVQVAGIPAGLFSLNVTIP